MTTRIPTKCRNCATPHFYCPEQNSGDLIPQVRVRRILPVGSQFRFKGLIAQGDVRINRGGLALKVVVFDAPVRMRYWWNKTLASDLGRRCLGAVNALGRDVEVIPSGKKWRECDSTYYAIMGLTQGNLNMRIITHESVHAGMAYIRRKSRNWWDKLGDENAEEILCYPVGEIAAGVVGLLERKKLLP